MKNFAIRKGAPISVTVSGRSRPEICQEEMVFEEAADRRAGLTEFSQGFLVISVRDHDIYMTDRPETGYTGGLSVCKTTVDEARTPPKAEYVSRGLYYKPARVEIKCVCGGTVGRDSIQTFSNKTTHIRRECANCKRFIKFVSQR